MDLRECQSLALAVAAQYNDDGDPFRALARVLEEAGEVASEIAKLEGTGSKGAHRQRGDLHLLENELADVLINLAGLANTYNLNLDHAMERKRMRFIEDYGRDAVHREPTWASTRSKDRVCVTVYCSSSNRVDSVYTDRAAEFGTLLAGEGWDLMYGGGSLGLMGAVSHAAARAGATVRAVILERFLDNSGAQDHIHDLRAVSDMRSRKRGLHDDADVIVALPGGFGTFEEITEALSFKTLDLHHAPVVFLNTNGYYDGLLTQLDACFEQKFAARPPHGSPHYFVASTPHEAIEHIHTALTLPPQTPTL